RRRDKMRSLTPEENEPLPPRREKFERKERDRDDRPPRRDDRGGRRDRERDRGPRYEKRPSDTLTDGTDEIPAGINEVPTAPMKKPSDREIFEAMQAGKPMPLTVGAGPEGSSEEGGERRPRRPRRAEGGGNVRAAEPGQVRLWVNLGKA